jgi:flagellar M-ring protein FliF
VTDDAAALQASLQSALDLVLGPGSSIVRVRINYDPRVRALRDVVRRPAGARAILATTTDERFKSAVKQYTKTSASLDRGSEVQDERVDTPAGRVERLSVAIAVDARRRADLGKIRALASAALGLDPARGDVVSVEELPFPRDVPARAGTLAAALAFASALGPPVAVALAFVASLRASGRPLLTLYDAIAHRVALRRASRSATANVPPAQVRGVLQNEPPHTAAAIISALPAATATAVLEMYPPEERAAIVRRMSRAAAPVVPDCDAVLRRG